MALYTAPGPKTVCLAKGDDDLINWTKRKLQFSVRRPNCCWLGSRLLREIPRQIFVTRLYGVKGNGGYF